VCLLLTLFLSDNASAQASGDPGTFDNTDKGVYSVGSAAGKTNRGVIRMKGVIGDAATPAAHGTILNIGNDENAHVAAGDDGRIPGTVI